MVEQSNYGFPSPLSRVFPAPIITTRDPTTSDTREKGLVLGQEWVNTSNDTVYVFTSEVSGAATWSLSTAGSSQVDTLEGDTGGAISPTGGNLVLAGGTNINTAGTSPPGTITFNTNNDVTFSTSVTSPIYTTSAGADTNIRSAAGQDILVRMGDALGANFVNFQDSGNVTVASIDSDGNLTAADITMTGNFTCVDLTSTGTATTLSNTNTQSTILIGNGTGGNTISAGNGANTVAQTVNISSGNAGADSTVNILSGVPTAGIQTLNLLTQTGQAGTVNIGTGAAMANTLNIGGTGANVIGIGDTQTAGSVSIGDAMTSGTISIGGTGAQTGTITVAPSTASQTVNIANNAGTKTINIGNGDDGNVILIGNGINSLAQVINIATGAAAADSTVNILTGAATAGTQTLNIGTGASSTIMNIGEGTGLSTVSINGGSGGMTLSTFNAGDLNLISNSEINLTSVDRLALNSSAGQIAIGNNADAFDISVGDSASLRTVTIGSNNTTSSTVIQSGSGNLTIDGAGALEINSSGGVIGIGNDAVAQNINVGTGAAARTITIGNTTTTSSLVLQSGTGEITVTGTVKDITSEFLTRSGDDVTFQQSPLLQSNANTGAAPSGATGDVNLMCCQEGIIMEQFILGAGQTIIAPRMDANGLLVSLDLVAAEGAEYNFGAARTNSRHAFTIGTSAAFFFELEFRINDMDGADPYVFGFRKSEANNATFDSYTDYASIGMLASSSATNIILATELNAAGQTVTDTTDLWGGDAATNTLRVNVSAAGVVTYLINGVPPTVTAAFTFDNADVVVPFIRIFHSASPTEVNLVSMKIGFQP